MKAIWLLSIPGLILAIALLVLVRTRPTQSVPTATPTPTVKASLQYQVYQLPDSIVHTLVIPAKSRYVVTGAVSATVDDLATFAQQHEAIAVLNAGFFDPTNQKSTSYVTLQGELVADPRQNERLVGNPDLAPYLDQILDRTEFRQYVCQAAIRYDIVRHSAPTPADCQLQVAIGGGPGLLPTMTAVEEGFLALTDGVVIRDPLGSEQANARSAVGLTAEGDVIWLMVAQRADSPNDSGMSFAAIASFLQKLGAEKAMNLDGGSSSALYYRGKTVYGRLDEAGNAIQRPVKSVLLVREVPQ